MVNEKKQKYAVVDLRERMVICSGVTKENEQEYLTIYNNAKKAMGDFRDEKTRERFREAIISLLRFESENRITHECAHLTEVIFNRR